MKRFLSLAFALLMLGACSKAENNSFIDKEYQLKNAANNAEITLGFEGKDSRFFGKSAVNRYFGSYKLEGELLSFSPAGSTMMMGPRELMEAEQNYLQELSKIKSFKLDGKMLILYTSDNKELVFEQIGTIKGEQADNRYTKKAKENQAQ